MTRIAEISDRLRRLAKRREDEGIYTDAALCAEAAELLSTPANPAQGVSELPYPPVVICTDEGGQEHRVGVHEYRAVDRPKGGAVTISTYIGDHKWVEALLDPQSAKTLADLILSRPCVQTLTAAIGAGGQAVALEKRPVAFRVKDFADGWILFHDEEKALAEADATGALMQGLYVRDGSASPIQPGWRLVPEEPTEAMIEAHFAAHAKAKTVFAEVPDIWRAMLSAAPQPKGE